jgi:quinol monooxygenase YgiN
MPELQVIARYTITAGSEDEVLGLLPKQAAASEAEPGCLSFKVYRELGDERKVVLLERYVSHEALETHRETEHFKNIILGQVVPRLDSRVVELYDVAD